MKNISRELLSQASLFFKAEASIENIDLKES
jgi:hypothetical protein